MDPAEKFFVTTLFLVVFVIGGYNIYEAPKTEMQFTYQFTFTNGDTERCMYKRRISTRLDEGCTQDNRYCGVRTIDLIKKEEIIIE